MKHILFVAALATASPVLAADRPKDVVVYDHTKTVARTVPVTELRCRAVEKPIYGEVTRQGNAAEGALAGMIIGGLLGKGLTGDDNGAAAGAVMGGIVGADKGSKPKTERRIIGYETVEECNNVTVNRKEYVDVYSHSTVRFYIDGKRYVLEFQK